MRFMVIVKADKNSEAGIFPETDLFEKMNKFNEELVKAGVMLAGEGLHPTTKGMRIRFGDKQPVVTPGPFALTNDTIAGFWLIKVKSRDEAIDWMKQAPFGGGELELRQIFEAEDFAEHLPAEVREKEAKLREEIEARKAS